MPSPDPQRQKVTLAQTLPPLPNKAEVLKRFNQYYQEISQLKPVLFNYFPMDQNNPLSLPDSVGRILFHEQLVDIYGQPIPTNLSLLDNPQYKRVLESKIFLALAHHAIGVNFFKYLAPLHKDKLLKNLHVARQWQTASQLICEDLARESSIAFSTEFHPQHSLRFDFFPDIRQANLYAKKAVKVFLDKNINLFTEFFTLFLQPTKISKDQKNHIIENTFKIIVNQIASIDPIPQAFLVSITHLPKLTLNLHYPD